MVTSTSTSTEVKASSTEEKMVPTGATQVPTGSTGLQALTPIGEKAQPSQMIPSRISAQRCPTKPFAIAVVKDWYNNTLKISDGSTYNKLNGIFKMLQSNDMKTANYWLIQIEQIFLQLQNQCKQHRKREATIIDLVQSLCLYSTINRSNALAQREEGFYTGSSREQQALREIFSKIDSADMVNVRIQDFVSLLEICKVKTEKSRRLEAELTIQKMVILNQQNLIEDSQLLSVFKSLEATNIAKNLVTFKEKFNFYCIS